MKPGAFKKLGAGRIRRVVSTSIAAVCVAWVAGQAGACARFELQPVAHPVPGDGIVLPGPCAAFDYVVLPITECAFLTCSGSLVYAFCDKGRYSYCGCAEGDEPLPAKYHRVRPESEAADAGAGGSAGDAPPGG